MTEFSRRQTLLSVSAALAAPAPVLAAPAPPAGLASLSHAIEQEVRGLSTDPQRTVRRIQALLVAAAEAGRFDAWRGPRPPEAGKVTLIGEGLPWRKWKVQLFLIPPGSSHPPHCHENLASCLVVVDGRLRVREYQRLRERDTEEWVVLKRAFDGELGPRQAIATTEHHRNAHWFGAPGGPVLAVNFKASGYVRPELLRLQNRRYVDPSDGGAAAFRAPFISRDTAHERFASRVL